MVKLGFGLPVLTEATGPKFLSPPPTTTTCCSIITDPILSLKYSIPPLFQLHNSPISAEAQLLTDEAWMAAQPWKSVTLNTVQ